MRPAPRLRPSRPENQDRLGRLGHVGHLCRLGVCAVLLWAAGAAGSGPASAQEAAQETTQETTQEAAQSPARNLVLGTGPVAGHYYPTGGALCRLINQHRAEDGLRCLVEATAGAEENLTRLRAGDLAIALVPSDWQYHAYRSGLGTGGDGPFTELRAVVSLQALSFTVLAAPSSGIATLADLKGKRINLGPPNTPWRSTSDFLVAALGWSPKDFDAIGELDVSEQAAGLCDGRVDALLLPASHPSGPVAEATERCGARLLAVNGEAVDRLLGEWDFYAPAVIPGALYAHNPEPVASFGLRATLVASEALDAETVYRITKRIFEGLDELRAQHAVLAGLTAEDMAAAALSAPLHAGALRYYQERGWR